MILNNYINPENVCYGSLFIFAFWYIEFILATRMKKLNDIQLVIVELNSLMLYFYAAIALYFFNARWNIIITLFSNGLSLMLANLFRYSSFSRDSKQILLFNIVQSIYTYPLTEFTYYTLVTLFMYFTFNKFVTAYIFSSMFGVSLLILNNLFMLPFSYFIFTLTNLIIVNICVSYRFGIFFTEQGMKLKTIYLNFMIPFLITMLETNYYKNNIILYDIKYKWLNITE